MNFKSNVLYRWYSCDGDHYGRASSQSGTSVVPTTRVWLPHEIKQLLIPAVLSGVPGSQGGCWRHTSQSRVACCNWESPNATERPAVQVLPWSLKLFLEILAKPCHSCPIPEWSSAKRTRSGTCLRNVQKLSTLLNSFWQLTYYDPTLLLRLAADASQYGLGAIIYHVMPNGIEKPIAFTSRSLTILK